MATVQLKYSCPEKWETMKFGLHSRHCDSCKQNVIDFTNKTREEILKYILSNHNKQICGRFYPSQLDFRHTDILVVIEGLSQRQKNSNLPFYLLTVGTLILTSCNNSTTDNNSTSIQQDLFTRGSKTDTIENKSQAYNLGQTKQDTAVKDQEIATLGIVVDPDRDTLNSDDPYDVTIMPEFVGGIDSLMNYLKANINYPKWEMKNKIHGTVYVSFTVEKTGKIKNAKILKSVNGSKNFDAEVLPVINNMPNWKPGEHRNKKIDVPYNLPIRFKL